MVEVIAIERPLCVAHTGDSAVQRIAEPVDDQAQARQPQPINAVVREEEPETAECRAEKPEPEAPIDPDTGRHKTYFRFDAFIRTCLLREMEAK